MNHCRLSFYTGSEELRGRLIALLDEAGFTAFEETHEALVAFIPEPARQSVDVQALLPEPVRWEESVIEPQNWNAAWEASFEPVVVPGFCTVRASFHERNPDTPHDIVITPKMSFGTGHHATTRLMMTAMRTVEFSGKRVLDFGTGTGILGILAAQLGSHDVLAIDNDEWSVENAEENISANEAVGLRVGLGSLELAAGQRFDIILANINRHILLEYMQDMRRCLAPGGHLLLSGILDVDESVVSERAESSGFRKEGFWSESGWICMAFCAN